MPARVAAMVVASVHGAPCVTELLILFNPLSFKYGHMWEMAATLDNHQGFGPCGLLYLPWQLSSSAETVN